MFSDIRKKLKIPIDITSRPQVLRHADYSFKKEIINLGRLKINTEKKFEFFLTNNSKKPIVINLVRSSCSCTELEWTKSPLFPNDEGVIKGSFQAKKKGRFFKQMFVHLSSDKAPLGIINLEGFVE